MSDQLIIYSKLKHLLNRIYPALKNYPRVEKHALCYHIKDTFNNALLYVNKANFIKSKRRQNLEEVEAYVFHLNILMELSKNQKYISRNFYEIIDEALTEISKMVSSWIKTISTNSKR